MTAHRNAHAGPCLFALAGLAAAAIAQPRGGQLYIWDGEAGDSQFFNSTNWDPDALPGPNDEALINQGGPVTAASLPIEVGRLTVETALHLSSSSIFVSLPSSIHNLTADGCCAVEIDSGSGPLTIAGDSAFNRRALFLGQLTRIQDQCDFADGITVRSGASLLIDGLAVLQGNTHTIETDGAVVVEGSLELRNADLFSANNAAAVWEFESGELIATELGYSQIRDALVMNSGRIHAEETALSLEGAVSISDSVASVAEGSLIIRAGPGPMHPIGFTSFEGDGTISLQNGTYSLNPSGGITTANVSGTGLRINAGLRLDGTLSNSGVLAFESASLYGPNGSLSCDAGVAFVVLASEIGVPTTIRAGATLFVNAPLALSDILRINAGGLVELNSSIVPSLIPERSGQLDVNGQLRTANTSTAILRIQNSAVTMNATGQILVRDRSLSIEHGGTLSAGNVVLENSAFPGDPTLTFGGEEAFTFRNGIEISDLGDRAEVFIGNGFGDQPAVSIEGDLIIDVDGNDSIARVRVPSVSGAANSRLLNRGSLLLERTATYSTRIDNEGSLTIAATTTMDGATIFNRSGASVDQSSSVRLDTGELISNAGVWRFPTFGRVENATGVDPQTTGFLNQGQLLATGGTSAIETRFTNLGFVLADAGHLVFTNTTTLDNAGRRVLKGNWRTINNGTISVPQDPPTVLTDGSTRVSGEQKALDFLDQISDIEDDATLETGDLDRPGDLRLDQGNLEVTEAGTVNVDGDLDMANGSKTTVRGGGALNATQDLNIGNDDPVAPSVLDDLQGSIALARGTPPPPSVSASAINVYANLTPVLDDTGVMLTAGLLTVHPTGTLRVNAAADGVNSGIVHTGDLDIQGAIAIEPLGGYQPAPGDQFIVATVSGSIHALPLSATGDPGPGLVYAVSADGGGVVVTVAPECPADLAAPYGILNFFDIAAYLGLFNTGSPAADLAAPFGTLNFFDLAAYLALYNGGCP